MEATSKFSAELYEKHLREASEWVHHCKRTGTPIFDVCGPRGDLFFLLKTENRLLSDTAITNMP